MGRVRTVLQTRRAIQPSGDYLLNPTYKDMFADPSRLKNAAVLMLVIEREEGASVLFTLRTAHLRAHAGQISLPGGKVDEEDDGPVDAALREANEEVGLDLSRVTTVGALGPYMTATGYSVTPVIATVPSPVDLTLNPQEVEESFEVPLSFLMNPYNHREESKVYGGKRVHFYAMPYEGHYIFGVTAGILRSIYNKVYTP